MLSRRDLLASSAALAAGMTLTKTAIGGQSSQAEPATSIVKKVALLDPPFVHPHDQRVSGPPITVQFEMDIIEKEIEIDEDGTTVHAMTFNGTVPGPLMVVHEGDYVELTLRNPASNSLPHNIDFHASTGALGGGELTLISPGEQFILRFKATKPGVFVYHRAPGGLMIPWYVVSGMNGAIMILPRDGLRDDRGRPLSYDRIYFIGEQDFYVPRDAAGKYKRYADAGDGMDDMLAVMRTLTPSHVVFNGRVGALTGDQAMPAKVGENLLIIHAQANRDTRPHLIGGHGDFVWETGKFNNPPQRDLETWFVRGGSAAAALYRFRQPGLYAYVNHNLIEAVMLGGVAHFEVEGAWDDDLMKQIQEPVDIPG